MPTNHNQINNKVIIITGEKGEGKTTKILSIIKLLNVENINIIGFTAKAEWENGKRSKYTLIDIATDKTITMCSDKPNENYNQYGRFYFNPLAIRYGNKLLSASTNKKSIIVIDEIGPFELDNKLWHNSLQLILNTNQNTIILSVRKKLVSDIIDKYKLENVVVFSVSEPCQNIIKEIKLTN